MAVRDDFSAGEVLSAGDLNDTFASKLDLAGGKILQIVRATDSTERSTTSTTFVDVTGMSVTITPQKSDSAILIIASFVGRIEATTTFARAGLYRITDGDNNSVSGAEQYELSVNNTDTNRILSAPITMIGRDTPATTSAKTYKVLFRVTIATDCTNKVRNDLATGQLYAIEVSA